MITRHRNACRRTTGFTHTQWTLSTHFLFCTRHELHTHRYVFLRCMDGALNVSDVLFISDRCLGSLSGACAARSPTAMQRRIGTLTMKIGYRLDPDDVWRTRYDTRPQGCLRRLATPFCEWCACFAAPASASCYHDHPLSSPFRSISSLLALRRTTTSLWYVPRARRYTGASSLSRSSPPVWNGFLTLAIHLRPTKTIPHLARTACFIITLLITFCHDSGD